MPSLNGDLPISCDTHMDIDAYVDRVVTRVHWAEAVEASDDLVGRSDPAGTARFVMETDLVYVKDDDGWWYATVAGGLGGLGGSSRALGTAKIDGRSVVDRLADLDRLAELVDAPAQRE